ncbi:hypothetical protein B7494_g5875 [Chlorociboria aeruginascens]|nr:hypothetical protein B7494_g5875 [Chlorociboria aeruginascens]
MVYIELKAELTLHSVTTNFHCKPLQISPKREMVEVVEFFSRLEHSFARERVVPRRNSIEMNDVNRHARHEDNDVNDLEFEYSLEPDQDLSDIKSMQDIFGAAKKKEHLGNENNFSKETCIECFDTNAPDPVKEWLKLDSQAANHVFQKVCSSRETSHLVCDKPQDMNPTKTYRLVPLTPTKETSYGSRISITRSDTDTLFKAFRINPSYLLNLLGRPDYWAPQMRWDYDENEKFSACDFFCQYPRWNLQKQGAPLSVYMQYNAVDHLTTYILSHKEGDSSVNALKGILKVATGASSGTSLLTAEPFDIAVILSSLSFEASKYHVKRFQRFMWSQVNKLEDHLANLVEADQDSLGSLTQKLQLMSQNADSHLANAEVALVTASLIKLSHTRLHSLLSRPEFLYHRVYDSIEYTIKSVEKQKIWFLNYKNRTDGAIRLVLNLVTQQDSASNISLAKSMKQDSTSKKSTSKDIHQTESGPSGQANRGDAAGPAAEEDISSSASSSGSTSKPVAKDLLAEGEEENSFPGDAKACQKDRPVKSPSEGEGQPLSKGKARAASTSEESEDETSSEDEAESTEVKEHAISDGKERAISEGEESEEEDETSSKDESEPAKVEDPLAAQQNTAGRKNLAKKKTKGKKGKREGRQKSGGRTKCRK